MINLKVDDNTDKVRIDKYIADNCDNFSRNHIQKLIDDDCVEINGMVVRSSYRVKPGDVICIDVPENVTPEILPENIPLDILYEDTDVIVVNKPKGMVVHPAAGHYSGTLVNALMYHCKDLSGINGILRPGIVHRIDKDTTGLLVCAKNDFSHNILAKQLKDHSIKRRYQAVVLGNFKNDHGTVDSPIGRKQNDRKLMASGVKGGKNAVTHYKVLKSYNKYSYIECQLETGRTHQIRVHMKSIGHPIAGDIVYGGKNASFKLDGKEVEGQILHAKVLGFIHPRTEEYMEFDSELPEYFKEALDKLERMS